MARIGRQIPHFQEINLESIRAEFSDEKLYRYSLDMDYSATLLRENPTEKVCVILKNPSSADEKMADATIRKVETYVFKHFSKVKTLSILNLFAIRATDVKEVNQLLNQNNDDYIIGPENDKTIARIFAEADHIICAWGNNNGILPKAYNRRIQQIKMLLEKTNTTCWQVMHPKGTKQPLHGLMWGFAYDLSHFKPTI
ncbi:MAG: DUF1643 domain-containing protein [Bacteroidales bacterium]|jgi:hypothetical protein|nr:DUF1643 domain-containing protein [Bacteroidales bacterium]